MIVKRIVANIAAEQIDRGRAFYGDLLGMKVGHGPRLDRDLCF